MVRRLILLPLVATLLLAVFFAAPAAAQTPPPSLAGEEFGAGCSAFPPPPFVCFSAGAGSVTITGCQLQLDGTAILSFIAQGIAIGPYPGTFSESGMYTLGTAGSGGGGVGERVISFSSTFTIQSSAGAVSGTKSSSGVPQATDSHNFCTAFSGQFGTFGGAFANYVATIQTGSGSFSDSGNASAQVGGPAPPFGFFESFGPPPGAGCGPQSSCPTIFAHIQRRDFGRPIHGGLDDVVSATTVLLGQREWTLSMQAQNAPTGGFTGAQISVASSGPDLAALGVTGDLDGAGATCTATASTAGCVAPGSLGNGSTLEMGTVSDLSFPGYTTGFDSSRHMTGLPDGTDRLDVTVNLVDTRFANGGLVQVFINGGRAIVDAAHPLTVQDGHTSVPSCPPGPPQPGAQATCFNSGIDSGTPCPGDGFGLRNAQPGHLYNFVSYLSPTLGCGGLVKPRVVIGITPKNQTPPMPPSSTLTTAATVSDPALGTVTFSTNEPAQYNTQAFVLYLIVYPPLAAAFPASGAFVMGDGSASINAHVTFWGGQWAEQNSLSAGPARAAFKGFASAFTPNCGTRFTADPGNSGVPPETLPARVATLVTNSVSGPGDGSFSGTVTSVVVVNTDPGYAPDPGHPGTGQVVGVICTSS